MIDFGGAVWRETQDVLELKPKPPPEPFDPSR